MTGTLPPDPSGPRPTPSVRASMRTPATGQGYRARVLVVEDSATQAAALAALLTAHGYEAVVARSGEEALSLVPGGAVELVLTDIMMPGISGYDVCRAIKALPGGSDLPVVLLTGLSDPMDIVRGLECGADNYITKPYADEHLLTRVRQVMATRDMRRASRPGGAVDITFLGERFTITAGKEQILDLLVSSYEELVRTNDQVRQAARRARFLAEASGVLTASLDADTILRDIGRLVVPTLADVCLMDLVAPDGDARRVEVVSINPRFTSAAAVLRGLPPALAAGTLAADALEARSAVLQREARDTDAALLWGAAAGHDAGSLTTALEAHTVMVVPLIARGHALGVLTLVASTPSRHWGVDDIALAEELARQVALAVDNARLYAEAQQATRARDDVLAIVSHDLRNPVHAISMAASFVLELLPEGVSEQALARSQMATIQRAAQRATSLIRDLLDITRIEAGRLVVEPTPRPPADLVADALDEVGAMATDKKITITVGVDPDLPLVLADAGRVIQVFSNILGNAIKFTPEHGTITLTARRAEGAVHFAIHDSGPGIPAGHLPHLFNRYWQARETQKLGTGLGLFIAKGIVEAHGGTLWVESTMGEGSVFTFSLPAGDSPTG